MTTDRRQYFKKRYLAIKERRTGSAQLLTKRDLELEMLARKLKTASVFYLKTTTQ